MDNLIGYYLKDTPYYLSFTGEDEKDPQNYRRYYFLHENSIVYDSDGNGKELWTELKNKEQPDIYMIYGVQIDSWCKNYFMVMNPYSLTKETVLRVEGKILTPDYNKYGSPYLFLWKYVLDKNLCQERIILKGGREEKATIDTTCIFSKRNNKHFTLSTKHLEKAKKIDWNEQIKKVRQNLSQTPPAPLPYTPLLTEDFPTEQYKERESRNKDTGHWGQVKLLLSEIEFLQQVPKKKEYDSAIAVYIGAAGGYHTPLLSRMFPDVLFILYDGAKFAIDPSPNIIIRNELFLEDIKWMYEGMDILFISDIRSTIDTEQGFEEGVANDNNLNMNIVADINPWSSMLKYRLPFENLYRKLEQKDTETYLSGKCYWQAFGKRSTTETRLIIPQRPQGETGLMEEGSHLINQQIYENQCFYFNNKYRNNSFLVENPSFGVNYDTFKMFSIMREYFAKWGLDNYKSIRVAIAAWIFEVQSIPGMKRNTISNMLSL